MKEPFDLLFEYPLKMGILTNKTIGNILFDERPGREDNSKIILSHLDNQYIEITFAQLRRIVRRLLTSFEEKQINKGQTVILLTFQGCNELFTALLFVALAVRGCRTFLPMYAESEEFASWITSTNSTHIIIPDKEVNCLEGHEREKAEILEILKLSREMGLNILDNLKDFDLRNAILQPHQGPKSGNSLSEPAVSSVSGEDEALILTTSGTSGKSKLVVYEQRAYYLNCLAWQQAGFYEDKLLGGTGFTPMLTHTMGIRALINAIWTGTPVCLIITEWFITKPETVRYLLLKMKPAHITGGPAVYKTFLELFRTFPEMKNELGQYLRTLVSSGTTFDPDTAAEIYHSTGLHLVNAYGTTETQQVFSTLLSTLNILNHRLMPMGNPLPGTTIGLIKTEQEPDHFRLFIKSAFGHKRCIGEESSVANGFFDTGDIVEVDSHKCFYFVRRATLDYFKDCFGVKIPVNRIREYYKSVLDSLLHAEFYPVINHPGLGLLLFVNEPSIPKGYVTAHNILKKYSGAIEEINSRLLNTLEPFEFRHRHVSRILVLNQEPPLTAKGTISARQIQSDYHDLIARLTNTLKESCGIETVDSQFQETNKFSSFISPKLGALMSSLKINYSYHRGEKDTLFTYLKGEETEVLDVTGGYGTNLLGYNNPAIVNCIHAFLSSGSVAISNQLSVQSHAGLLAEKLSQLIGSSTGKSYRVVFGSSGSEAVEIAIHHALFEWKSRIEKMRDQQIQMFGSSKEIDIREVWNQNLEIINQTQMSIIALTNAFHGHTSGARSVLGNDKKRLRFSGLQHIAPLFLDDTSADWLKNIQQAVNDSGITIQRAVQSEGKLNLVPFRLSAVIAAIVEPVQGEGGVRVIRKDFIDELSRYEFPLISDEIQCGMGRTGELPECKTAHYYLFGKALGGGIEKISAVLIERSRYCRDFIEYYSSTFGNGELAARVGIQTIAQLENPSFLKSIEETGRYLAEGLRQLRENYPAVLLEVQGKGLMQGIRFNPVCAERNIFLRILFESEKAGYFFTAWLLHHHRIRMFPTLSAPFTLRLEPSAFFTEAEADRVMDALAELCEIIRDRRMYDLFSFLMDDDTFIESPETIGKLAKYNPILEDPSPQAVRTAFIGHFAFPLRELRMLEPDFARATDTGLRILFNRLQILLEMNPVKMIALNLFQGKVHLSFYVIPVDSSGLESLHKTGKRKTLVERIQKAVDRAALEGAEIISLGGYTSILTNNGLSLYEPPNVKIITGNTLTAASGLRHFGDTIRKIAEFNKPNIVAVVGATGNIGQVITEILCSQKDICSELLVINRSEKRAAEFVDEVSKRCPDAVKIIHSNDLSEVRKADVIIVCSNTNDPILLPHHIAGDKPVLISDLSVPSAVSSDVTDMKNVTMIPFAAYVTLPEDPDAVISSYSPPGTVFCCAAEAILIGLEHYDGNLKGKIQPEEVRAITSLAEKHKFFNHTGNLESFKSNRT